jgi:nucleoside-diphosphate-sugar epimerase
VDNVVEGMLLAGAAGGGARPGEKYFLTDGEPVVFKEFASAMLRTQGVQPPEGSVPRWVMAAGAAAGEWWCGWFGGRPPITRMAVALMGHEVTVNDAKARRELGYKAAKSREEGLRELQEEYDSLRRQQPERQPDAGSATAGAGSASQ